MRGVLAAFLIAHAISHVPGFVVPWRLMTSADMPYRTTLLNGLIDVGDTGIRVVGLAWLAAAAAFAIVAAGLLLRTGWWFPALLPLVAISLVLCLIELP